MDVKTPEQRSLNMSAIKSKNTKPEQMLRKALFKAGLRYRINSKLEGRPDIVFPRQKIAIFVDGCFWHGCPKCYTAPTTNKSFWENKLSVNIRRDKVVTHALEKAGWKVIRFWEHQIYSSLSEAVEDIKREHHVQS